MTLTTKEKINIIQRSERLEKVTLNALPDVHNEDYYFVSYSHLDYKQVYSDMLYLQEVGINIWYDRGLPAGHDWQQLAEEHISKYNCIGVIFYLSENALRSDAVVTEIETVKAMKKDYLVVMLPYASSHQQYEYLSPIKLLEKAQPNLSRDNQKYKIVSEAFPESVIYLRSDFDTLQKAEKIRGLKRPPLFNYIKLYNSDDKFGVASTNNISIVNVDKFDESYRITSIESCAFANCKRLKTLTASNYVEHIRDYAFWGCENLVQIGLHVWSSVGRSAFGGCENLKSIDLKSVRKIGEYAFYNCKKLENVVLGENLEEIGTKAFYMCRGLREIHISASVKTIGKDAFDECNFLTIYCQAKAKPENWDERWYGSAHVVWDSDHNNLTKYGGQYATIDNCYYLLRKDGSASLERVFGLSSSTLTIPEVVEYKGKTYKVDSYFGHVFKDVNNFEVIKFPSSMEYIDVWELVRFCSSLRRIEVDVGNSKYMSIDGVLYSKKGEGLFYPPNKTDETYFVPEFVTKLESYFMHNPFVKEIYVTKQVVKIEDYAIGSQKIFDSVFFLPESRLKKIGSLNAVVEALNMSECKRLKSFPTIVFETSSNYLRLPQSIKKFSGKIAGCSTKNVIYDGTVKQFLRIRQNIKVLLNPGTTDAKYVKRLLQDMCNVWCTDGLVPKSGKPKK